MQGSALVLLSYADIRTFKKKPYLVGGKQEPKCVNCLSNDGLAGKCSTTLKLL